MVLRRLKRQFLFSIALGSLLTTSAHAAKIISYCHMDDTGKELQGSANVMNQNQKYPVASVSKLFTSLVVATTYNLDQKFTTKVYATPVDKYSYDVHIVGSPDPYFNRYKMHMVISRLNEAGITSIRKLTFDENVKYLHDTDAYHGFRAGRQWVRPTVLKADMSYPPKELVKSELQQTWLVMKDYNTSFKLAKQAGMLMFKNPKFKVAKVEFLSTADFTPPTDAKAIKLFVASQDIRTMLKSMNWNSNNFAANRLLVDTGGVQKLTTFYADVLKMSANDLTFVNGSGQNHDLTGSGRLYNEASCIAVVKTVRALKMAVERQGKKLQDVVSVMGTDLGSTVGGKAYISAKTRDLVIAKTGTVGTNIALGGMINGIAGPNYFFINVQLNNESKAEEKRAHTLINAQLVKFIKQIGGAKPLNYVMNNPLGDSLENYDDEASGSNDDNAAPATKFSEDLDGDDANKPFGGAALLPTPPAIPADIVAKAALNSKGAAVATPSSK